MATPTTTDIQIATDTNFSTLSINETKPYCTTRTFVPDELPRGVDLYMRIRHHTDGTSMDTPWSDTRQFQIESDAKIIGVCLDNSDVMGRWYWIDKDGNKLDSFDSDDHPIFANIETVTLDAERNAACTMIKIPTVYVKTMTSGPINTFAQGKKCWWISDKPTAGFHPHPAFKRTTEKDSNGKYIIANYNYISINACKKKDITVNGSNVSLFVSILPPFSQEGITLTEYYNIPFPIQPLESFSNDFTYNTNNEYVKLCTNHNDESSGQSGWRVFDGYDIALIELLKIIRTCNFYDESVYNDDGSLIYFITLAKNQKFYNIRMLCLKDRMYMAINTNNNNASKPALLDPADYTKKIIFSDDFICRVGEDSRRGDNFIRNVLSGSFTIGDDIHDIMELFYANEFTEVSRSPFMSRVLTKVNSNNQTGISDAVALLCYAETIARDGSFIYAGVFGYGVVQSIEQLNGPCCMRIAKN